MLQIPGLLLVHNINSVTIEILIRIPINNRKYAHPVKINM